MIETLNRAAESWLAYLWPATWQSTLVAVILLVVVMAARRWPSPLRYGLLLVALIKFIIPPLLPAPASFNAWVIPPPQFTAAPIALVQDPTSSALLPGAEMDSLITDVPPSLVPVVPPTPMPQLTWQAWLMLAHISGGAAMLLWLAGGMLRLRHIIQRAQPIDCGPVFEEFRRVSDQMRVRRRVRLFVSHDAITPMALGVIRPAVLLPHSMFAELPADRRHAILAHELAHHRRGDLPVNYLQLLIASAWWFNPMIWFLNRAIRSVREDCCDDLVLGGQLVTNETYSQTLLAAAAKLPPRVAIGTSLGFAEKLHPLADRLRRIMDQTLRRPVRASMGMLVAIMLVAIVALPGLRHGRGGDEATAADVPSQGADTSQGQGSSLPDPASPTNQPTTQPVDADAIATSGVIIQGKVLEPETNKPVPGARVEANSPAGRLKAVADSAGEFSWRVPPGELFAFWVSPPADWFAGGPRGRPVRLPITGSERSVELIIYAPGPLRRLATVRGRLITPQSHPVPELDIEPVPGPGFQGSGWGARQTKTNADGSFQFTGVPAGHSLGIYAQTSDRALALATLAAIPAGKTDVDLGDLQLQRTESADVLISDARNNPLVNTALKVHPSFGDRWSETERTVSTDAQGHLRIDGIVPGLRYLLRDARHETSQREWLESFKTTVILLPIAVADATQPKPNRVTLATERAVRVIDPMGNVIPIKDIKSITVWIPDGPWQMGPKPKIVTNLDEGWVVVEEQHFRLAKTGAKTELLFETQHGQTMSATGIYPQEGTGKIQYQTESKVIAHGADTSIGPDNVGPEDVVGRVIDPAGHPVAGAKVSLPRHFSNDFAPPTSTDETGVFRFPAFGKTHYLYMFIEKPPFAARYITDIPIGKGFTVRMDDSTRFRGKLVLPDGSRVAGAVFTFRRDKPTSRINMGNRIHSLVLTAQANNLGEYDIPIEAGEYEVQIADGRGNFARTTVRIQEGQKVVLPAALAPGVRVRLQFQDTLTGQPVAGVHVWVQDLYPGAVDQLKGSERISNDAGTVEWDSLMPGLAGFELNRREQDYVRWWADGDSSISSKPEYNRGFESIRLDLQPGMATTLVHMEPGLKLTGQVVSPTGQFVPGAPIHLTGISTGDARHSTKSDEQGQFTFWVPPNIGSLYRLNSTDPQKRWANAVSEPFTGKAGEQRTLNLHLTTGGRITGRVVDAAGKPVASAKLEAAAADGLDNTYLLPRATTDDQGRFEIPAVRAGLHIVRPDTWSPIPVNDRSAKSNVVVAEGATVEVGDLVFDASSNSSTPAIISIPTTQSAATQSAKPATQPAGAVARPRDAGARASFLAVERIARLPADQQAEELAHLYRELAPRYMNPFVEGILSSYPQDILTRDKFAMPGNHHTMRWAGQLADAAGRQSPEEVADRLGGGLFLNVAARARALQVFSQHPGAMAKLLDEDLQSREVTRVERAANTILSLELHTFTDQLLALFLAGGETAAPAGRALTFLNDPAVVPILLAEVEKNPTLLTRCSGMLERPQWRKPADPLLLKLLDSGDTEVRYHATQAIYECTDPKLAGPILRLAKEDQARFRYAAAYMAGNLPAESFAAARDQLLPLLRDPDDGVRMNMMRSFAKRHDPAAGPVILDMLKRPQPAEDTKVTVLQSLAELVGSTLGYDLLAWGPGKPANDQAIRQLEAWLATRTPAAAAPATQPITQPSEAGR